MFDFWYFNIILFVADWTTNYDDTKGINWFYKNLICDIWLLPVPYIKKRKEKKKKKCTSF